MKIQLTRSLWIFAVSPTSVFAFGVTSKYQPFSRIPTLGSKTIKRTLRAKADDDEASKGMEEAFKQLDGLKSLGDDSTTVPFLKQTQDEAFAKAMKDLDLKDIEEISSAPPEREAALYTDMISELEGETETDLIDSLKTDMGGKSTEIPKFDPSLRETDKFMEKALDEALDQAEKLADVEIKKESLLDNKEIMQEIEKIFDKANDELLEGIKEIRTEQMALAKESAERNSKESAERIEEDQQRLAIAEDNMKKMLAKVNEETKNVEAAIEDLKKAQAETESGLENQLSGLKSGGIVKQATLVGTLLFSLRSAAEGVAYLGGDASHLLPAIVQAAIAVVCLVAFFFL